MVLISRLRLCLTFYFFHGSEGVKLVQEPGQRIGALCANLYAKNQPLRRSECDLSEAYSPEGRPLGTSKPQEDAFAVKRGSESAVSKVFAPASPYVGVVTIPVRTRLHLRFRS